jgi:membrane-bound serine protease (ClpP class)
VGATALVFVWVVSTGVRALFGRQQTGAGGLIGLTGVAREALAPEGQVQVQGELWRAVAEGGRLEAGARVRVVAVEGLTLRVAREGAPEGVQGGRT